MALNSLTLIIDKNGIFGDSLTAQLDLSIASVLVTAKAVQPSKNTIIVPFHKDIPEIPEETYSHIFFVWEGKSETSFLLEPLLEKAATDKAQFIFITDHHFYSKELDDYIHEKYSSAVMIIVGDVFGNDYYESIISAMFYTAKKEGVIRVRGAGLHAIYPVLFEDVVKEILRVGFGREKKRLFLACQEYSMTELSIAHLLQKLDPLIKIDFIHDEERIPTMPKGENLFTDTYIVVQKLQETYKNILVDPKKTFAANHDLARFSPFKETKKQKKQGKKTKKILFGIVFLFLVVLSPLILLVIYEGLGYTLLYAGMNTAKTGNVVQAVQFAQTSERLFSFAQSINGIASQELGAMLLPFVEKRIENSLDEANTLAFLAEDGFMAAHSFIKVLEGNSSAPSVDFLSGVNSIKNALVVLADHPLQGTIDGIHMEDVSGLVSQYASMVDILPTLFGFPKKRTYAILFQNNMELRPGGGFIGSYAIVTVDQGRIGNITIHDVYDADGQLKGHVEPPYVIRRYIPQVHWYLRDSNFDIDFSKDAENAAFFLKAETGQTVDGVIGVDLSFVKALLAITGPVYVPEYKQTVTNSNFFFLTESHAEKNTFAGSSQKKDFLRAFFTALQAKLARTHNVSLKATIPLLESVREKHVLFGFSDPILQDVVTVSGFSSSLWDGRRADNNTLLDFTGINEANIGVNKANAFVTRSTSQEVAIANDGTVSEKLSITYKNNSKPNQWPGGAYRNYIRFVLPNGATLTNILFDRKVQTMVPAVTDPSDYEQTGFIPPQGLEVDNAVEEGKQVYGFLVSIPVQQTKEVGITYTLSQRLDLAQPTITYNEVLFKQPGLDEYPYTFSLTAPNNFEVLQKPSWITKSDYNISFQKPFVEDTPFVVTFTKK